MATTHFSQSLLGSLDTAVAGTSMNALASASYALGSAINNTPTDGTTISYDVADLTLTFSSGITTGSAPAYLSVWILPSVDGTNYPVPGDTTHGAPAHLGFSFDAVASTSTTTIVCPNIPIPPYNFKVLIQNNLGVTFPATNTSTCQIQRKTVANW